MNRATGFHARYIQQPGPALEPRRIFVPVRGLSFTFELEPGLLLLEAVRRGFAARGFISGVAELGAVALGPFAYVMPALSKDGKNAAFYSETYRPAGITRLEAGSITLGVRDEKPFFHCHALWREADSKRSGGHILPEETYVAEPITVTAFGLDGACFDAPLDGETNFRLFSPRPISPVAPETSGRAIAARLKPNQDFTGAIEALCAEHGFRRARLRGGVGSTIGSRMVDGTEVANFATEVFIRNGVIEQDEAGHPRASIDVGLVDFTGGLAEGRLINGDNPVLMTFEIVIEEIGD